MASKTAPHIRVDLRVEPRSLPDLVPFARNARTHSDQQIDRIANSIRKFGFTNPVLVDGTNGIVAGHGRVLAARKLGLEQVPVIELAHLSEVQKRAYVIADNKLAELAGWDRQMLALEVGELDALGVDLKALGFETGELDDLLRGTEPDPKEDEVPELTEASISQPGDIWRLGNHRLICGDSTDPETVSRLLDGARPPLMVTDPPYGVEYDPSWRNRAAVSRTTRLGKVLNDDRADWRQAWSLFPGDAAYVWHGALQSINVAESLVASGFDLRAQIIWAKERLVLGRGDYHWQHEPCWYAVRQGSSSKWTGDRKQTTLWSIASGGQDCQTIHGTQKPVACMRRPILNNSSRGQAVYEPFAGSGTTVIAAEATGRHCYAIELDSRYVDLIVKRWEGFTRRTAVLAVTGETMLDLAARRTREPSL